LTLSVGKITLCEQCLSATTPTHAEDKTMSAIEHRWGSAPDVRCAATLEPLIVSGQCQLYVGHEGAHTLLDLELGERTLRRWRDASVVAVPFGSEIAFQLPWAPGLPALTHDIAVLPTAAPTVLGTAAPVSVHKRTRRRRQLHAVA
jgi:hypothetical protein